MRMHVSLNVRDVGRSVDFYKSVFGAAPQKQTASYAKFDLQNPALNFSMQSGSGEISRVSHLGVEVESAQDVWSWQRRLESLGIQGRVEESVECCFARQDKFWFADPDGNEWEVFHVSEQLPVIQEAKKQSSCCAG